MKEKRNTWLLWYLLGFTLFMFTRSTLYVPIALVLAPIFILRFARAQSTTVRAIWLTLLGFLVGVNIALWGFRDTGDLAPALAVNLIMNSLLALALSLPYLADRLLVHRVHGFLSSLVFPVSASALYFLLSLDGPFDGDGVFAHYFIGGIVLKQVVSLTGLWGLVFLVSWTSSVVNWAWENSESWEKTRQGLLIFACVVTGVFLFGGLKLSRFFSAAESETVRVAAITTSLGERWMAMLDAGTSTPSVEATMTKIGDLVARAAVGGAKIVVFQESSILVEKADEGRMFAQLGEIAKENAVYLSFTYLVFIDGAKEQNRQVFFNDNGGIEANYQKRFLLGFGPFGETAYIDKGPGILPVVETPYGTIGFGICRDMSFAPYARQLGRKGADIVFDPSDDFPRSKGYLNLMRAIENGFSLIRPTRNGITYAVDYYGNVLAAKDYFASPQEIMYADVPTRGTATLYAIIGDAFGWLCVVGFIAFIVLARQGSLVKE